MPSTLAARILGQTALVALLLPAGLTAARAQDTVLPSGEILLDELTIERGDGGTGPVNGRVDAATLTGSKTAVPVTEIPQSVSIIGAEELEAANANKIDSVLGYVAGVQGAPYGFDSDTNWHFIRGFQTTATGVYQDGLQHYSYGFGGYYIDPFLVERIEVLRGAASVLYGGSSPGGLLNYVSKTPTGIDATEAEIGVDEEGRAWTGLDMNRVTEGGLAYRLTGKVERVDGNGAFDAGFHGVLAPSLSFTTDDGTDITVIASYTKVDEDHAGGSWLPYVGTVEDGDFGRIDRDFNTSEPSLDWYEREQFMLTGIISKDFGAWTLNSTTRAAWSDVDESAPYGNGLDDATDSLYRLLFAQTSETTALLNDTRAETTLTTGGAEHRLMFGIDSRYFELDQEQAFNFGTNLSIDDPDYGQPQPDLFPPYIDGTTTQQGVGLYAQDQIRWGDGWIATLNLRHDWVWTESEGLPDFETDDSETTWRAGIAKEFANGLTPYASYATYFNPQIGTLSNGDPQQAETGEQYEIGVKWQPTGRNLLVTAALFDITRDNVVQTNGIFVTEQLGRVSSRGFEIEAKGEVAPGLTLAAAYTDMDVEIEKTNDATTEGKTPFSVIDRFASLKLTWDVPQADGLTLTGGVRWLGDSWADNENTLKVPSVTLYDAGASYDFADGWKANLAVTNLTDETYVSSCQGASYCFYGDGRRASLSLARSF